MVQSPRLPKRILHPSSRGLVLVLSLWLSLSSCETPPPQRNLPPSETDLILLKPGTLCLRKTEFLKQHPPSTLKRNPWGTGEELIIPIGQSATGSDESYFFDEDGTLVGTLFTFPSGLDLDPYSVLRHTLSLLNPTLEFYLNVANLPTKANMYPSSLFETGDEKTTTQYLVVGAQEHPILLQASMSIDPYVRLFSPYRREFLTRLRNPGGQQSGQHIDSQGSEDKEPFASLQQFARGQAAQLSYCGQQHYDIAADAYKKSIDSGFSNKIWQAEAHHKYGQALFGLGQYEKAKAEMLQALAMRPNTPEILNNLGSTQKQLGDNAAAQASFEKAILLKPNYAIARYNFAESIESTNPRRATTEYETYLALAEGIPEEADRIAVVKQRLKDLKSH